MLLATYDGDLHQTSGKLHRETDGEFQAMLDAGLHKEAVDDHLDSVILALVERNVVFQIQQLAINASASESVLEPESALALA